MKEGKIHLVFIFQNDLFGCKEENGIEERKSHPNNKHCGGEMGEAWDKMGMVKERSGCIHRYLTHKSNRI